MKQIHLNCFPCRRRIHAKYCLALEECGKATTLSPALAKRIPRLTRRNLGAAPPCDDVLYHLADTSAPCRDARADGRASRQGIGRFPPLL